MKITSKEKRFKKYVEHEESGALTSEADFIAGASAVFAFMNRMDLVSPMWIFYPMGGRDMVEGLVGKSNKVSWLIDHNNDCPEHCK